METSTRWQLAKDSAEGYARILVPAILGPAARTLVDFLPWTGVETVLDAGCGTGAALGFAAAKAGPTATLVGLDVNQGMLEVAKSGDAFAENEPQWVNASMEAMPFKEGHFDVVLCAQTLQFLKAPESALAEIHRVLKPGGRLGLSLWCGIQENPYFHALTQAISHQIGASTAAGLEAAFDLTGPAEIQHLVHAAGFSDIKLEQGQFEWVTSGLPEFIPRHVGATPMAAGFEAATPQARQAVTGQVVQALEAFGKAGVFRLPFCTHLLMAKR